jgi:hypothetical protein
MTTRHKDDVVKEENNNLEDQSGVSKLGFHEFESDSNMNEIVMDEIDEIVLYQQRNRFAPRVYFKPTIDRQSQLQRQPQSHPTSSQSIRKSRPLL